MNMPVHAPTLLKALEGTIIAMPCATKEEIEVTRMAAAGYLAEMQLWQRIGESDRASAFLRVLRTLVNDPRGPGYEMLNEYARLREGTHTANGEHWRDFWPQVSDAAYPARATVSKLSELRRDEIHTLTSAHRPGTNWIPALMNQILMRSDSAAQRIHDLAFDRMPWLRALTEDDFVLPIEAHYGLIPTTPDNKAMLAAFGVEVGEYDHLRSAFHVRVNASAYRNLEPYAVDFPLGKLHRWDDNALLQINGQSTDDFLQGAKAHLNYLVHSDANDERTTASGSHTLDCWFELLEEIEAEQIDRAARGPLERHTEGRADPARPSETSRGEPKWHKYPNSPSSRSIKSPRW
ncbi:MULTISPECIES: hypothetical protein [Cupriavidus]